MGFVTTILAVEAVVRSLARTPICNWVALTNAVVRAEPFQDATAPLTKEPAGPLMVRVNAGVPCTAVLGTSPVRTGWGLFTVAVTELVEPIPPMGGDGFSTVTV